MRNITQQDRRDFANSAYSQFLKTGKYDDLGNIVYDSLDAGRQPAPYISGYDGENIVRMPSETKGEIFRACVSEELKNIPHLKARFAGEIPLHDILPLIDCYINATDAESVKRKIRVTISAKKKALIIYFQSLQIGGHKTIPYEKEPAY